MSTIALQAAAGGQINLNGTNTASTFDLTVPAINSTLATLTGVETLTNKTLVAPALGTPASGVMTNVTGLPLTTGVTGTLPVTNGGTGVTTSTGSGANVLGTAPTIYNALVTGIRETATVSATGATGTIQFDALTQVVLYYTTASSGNFTINFRGNSGTSLDSVMSTGQSLSATFLVTNTGTAYYNSAVTIDGNSVTPKWQGGSAPTSGNANSVDGYTYVIIKTGSATFTVLTSVTKFA
jgi:hypothetical protein